MERVRPERERRIGKYHGIPAGLDFCPTRNVIIPFEKGGFYRSHDGAKLIDPLHNWMEENLIGFYRLAQRRLFSGAVTETDWLLCFTHSKDAMLFKLTWGGS